MYNAENIKELESLRQEINDDIVKYIEHRNEEEYKDLLDKSKELDYLIVKYIESCNKKY